MNMQTCKNISVNVQKLINIGGVAVVMDTYTTKLYQAMVKRQPA